MSDLFLSYHTSDRERVQPLITALERSGWSVSWVRHPAPGKTVEEAVNEALGSARCVIAVWSKESVSSEAVKAEAAEAYRRGNLVSVLIDDVVIPTEFRRIETAALTGWDGTTQHAEFDKLRQAIRDAIPDIFISYSRDDRDRVQPLAAVLADHGWSVWWDPHLRTGQDFAATIQSALKAAGCVIVVWSNHSIESRWVLDEATVGERRGVLVPVRFDEVDRPLGFGQLQTADLIDWQGESSHGELDKLVADIAKILQTPPPTQTKSSVRARDVPYRGRIAQVAQRIRRSPALVMALLAAIAIVAILMLERPVILDPVLGRRTLKVVVGEFEAEQLADEDQWMRSNTRDSLNAILSKVGSDELEVMPKERIDWEQRTLGIMDAAKSLGVHKMISGVISATGSNITIQVRITDVRRDVLEDTFPRKLPRSDLIELQNEAAEYILQKLHIQVTPERKSLLFAGRTNDNLEASKLLTESLGGYVEEDQPTSLRDVSPEQPVARLWDPAVANAQAAPADDQAAIAALLQQYSAALEAKNIDQFANLHLQMDERQRESLRRYFANAEHLHVKISNVDIVAKGDEALATFTRTDEFKEVPSGRDVQLEVRLSSLLTKQDGQWKIRGLKKPS